MARNPEISEDCVSRKWLVDNAKFISKGEWIDKNMWVVPLSKLDDAPPVVPKARPIEIRLDITDDVIDCMTQTLSALTVKNCGGKLLKKG